MKAGEHTTELTGEAAYDFIEKEGLEELASSEEGWSTLYRGPSGRLWEKTYPQSHQHGGGPPLLHALPEGEAKEKYGTAVAGRGGGKVATKRS